MPKVLKKLEGNRTYLLLLVVMTVVTAYVGMILHRALNLPDEMFVDALPGIGDMIGEYGFLLFSGFLGYAGSKGGSALKSWSYWSNMGQQRYRKQDNYDQFGGVGFYGDSPAMPQNPGGDEGFDNRL